MTKKYLTSSQITKFVIINAVGWTLLFLSLFTTLPVKASGINGKRMVGYYIEWGGYARKFYTDQMDANLWTHINYSFIKPTWDASTQTAAVLRS